MNYLDLFPGILSLLVNYEDNERETIELGPDEYTIEDESSRELPADDVNH